MENPGTEIRGTAADETLFGGDGNDTIIGDRGDDVMNGLLGDDTYRFNAGFGSDRLSYNPLIETDYDTAFDQIRFGAGLNPEDMTASRINYDLRLTFASGEELLINDHFISPRQQIDRITFGDGTIWYPWKIEQQLTPVSVNLIGTDEDDSLWANYLNDTLFGGGGADRLFGVGGNDDLTGGGGDDLLIGGNGSDTYRYATGDGDDRILAFSTVDDRALGGGFDQLILGQGIRPEDITVVRNESDAALIFADDARLTLSGQFDTVGEPDPNIDRIVFDDGTIWYPWKILQQSAPVALNLSGTDGDDSLRASVLDDTISGGLGSDTLLALSGNDDLSGGRGLDILVGGPGSDTYRYELGDGDDWIYGFLTSDDRSEGGGFDQIILGAGIDTSDVTITREDNHAVLTFADGARLTLMWQFDTVNQPDPNIDRVVFDDGTIWYAWKILQLSAQPTQGDDVVILSEGDNLSNALDGDDTVEGLDGNDTLLGGAGRDQLEGGTGNDQLLGGDGNDRLLGGTGDDQLTGGAGNDALRSGAGSDTYVFEAGFGTDRIENDFEPPADGDFDQILFGEGIRPDQVSVRSDSDESLILSVGEDRLTVEWHFALFTPSIGRVKFADGTIWYQWKLESLLDFTGTEFANDLFAISAGAEMFGLGGDDTLYGQSGDDRLLGGDDQDLIFAGAGTNTLIGGTGSDTLYGGGGSDSFEFARGDGVDFIRTSSGSGYDQIRFTSGVTSEDILAGRSGEHLVLYNLGSGDSVRVDEFFVQGKDTIERITFRDGTVWYADTLADIAQQANDLANELYGTDGDDVIEGLAGNDLILGENGDDTLHGGADTDSVYGGAGNDRLSGGAGHDAIYGEAGDDTLIGGSGNDTLTGREGNDTYFFDANFGNDLIFNYAFDFPESDGSDADFDRIVFSATYAPEDFTVLADESNSLILIANDGSQISVDQHFDFETHRINEVSFADGTVWTPADLLELSRLPNDLDNRVNGSNDPDTIDGRGGNDEIYGVGGADTLYGGEGSDTLYGQAGDDTVYGDAGNDVLYGDNSGGSKRGDGNDMLFGGDGNDWFHPGGGTGIDTIDGGDGSDTLSFDQAGYWVTASIVDGTSSNSTRQTTTFTNIENLTGTPGFDTLTGDDGDNIIRAGWGDDQLFGLGGDDHLHGMENDDTIDGGDGFDRAYFRLDQDDYAISTVDGVTTVISTEYSRYVDTLTNVEMLVFADGEVLL